MNAQLDSISLKGTFNNGHPLIKTLEQSLKDMGFDNNLTSCVSVTVKWEMGYEDDGSYVHTNKSLTITDGWEIHDILIKSKDEFEMGDHLTVEFNHYPSTGPSTTADFEDTNVYTYDPFKGEVEIHEARGGTITKNAIIEESSAPIHQQRYQAARLLLTQGQKLIVSNLEL